MERVQEKYLPLIQGVEKVIPCIFSYQNIPIGYLQYYALNDLSHAERQQLSLKGYRFRHGKVIVSNEPKFLYKICD